MHVKWNVKRSVCAKHAAPSSSPSVNLRLSKLSFCNIEKPPGSRLAAFLSFKPDLTDGNILKSSAVRIWKRVYSSVCKGVQQGDTRLISGKEHDQGWHCWRYGLHGRGIAADSFHASASAIDGDYVAQGR